MGTQYAPALAREDSKLGSDPRWELILRVTESPHFSKATQPREILLYICRRQLLEHSRSITESDIARDVLQRRADFDPSNDSIVRVQISHIRKKLDAYFLAEGSAEKLRVSLPKGTYLPFFEPVPGKANETPSTIPSIQLPISLERPDLPPARVERSRWSGAFAFALGVIVGCMAWAIVAMNTQKSSTARTAAKVAQNHLLAAVFDTKSPVSIVIADGSFSLVEDALKVDLNVNEYTNREYLAQQIRSVSDPELQRVLSMAYGRQYTSLGEATVALKFADISRQFGSESLIRYARHLNVRDFDNGNFVLIGSRRGLPWTELFESQLNFVYVKDPQSGIALFKNRKPQAGEETEYVQRDGKESYVDIALVPNFGNNGHVLVIRGLGMEANEGAASFLFSPDAANLAVFKNIRLDEPKQVTELLLRDHVTDGGSSGVEVVAVRQF